jgi:hypothetical protein
MFRFAPRIRLPKYRHHKAKDLALVTFDGRDYYLGKYGSPESRTAYDQLIGHWVPSDQRWDSQVCVDINHKSTSATTRSG